jgi:hypothetical protein
MMTNKKKLAEQAAQRIASQVTKRQLEAGKRLEAALEGDIKSRHWIAEGIATSDIPTLLQPTINVKFLEQYAATPTVWQELATEVLADSFGGVKYGDFQVDGSALAGNHGGEVYVNGALPVVGEYDEYPAVKFAVQELSADLKKSGVRARLSWEAIIESANVDLISEFITYFGSAAAKTEDVKLARQFANAGGTLNTTNWTATNQISGNPALTIGGLELALEASKATTVNGNPVTAPRYKLVVTPALEMTARRVLSINTVTVTDANGTYDVDASLVTGNIDLVVLDEIAAAELGGSALNAYWWLIPSGGARPAFGEIFLRNYRTPLVSIKDSGHFAVGGGEVPARLGSFEVDDVQTRIRHVVDAAPISLAGAVWSNGTNS